MILMYHNIGEKADFNTVSLNQFEKQMAFLKNNFNILDAEVYLKRLVHSEIKKESVLITFDDAYLSYLHYAFPLLLKNDIPSTLFIPVSHIGKENSWDRSLTNVILKIMKWEEIQKVSNERLVTVGSHGMSHISLGKMNKEELCFEIAESKKVLEEKLNIPIRFFSYPYGQYKDFTKESISVLKEFNYLAAFSTIWRKNNPPNNLYRLGRVEIEPNDQIEDFKRKCTSFSIKKRIKQVTKNLYYKALNII